MRGRQKVDQSVILPIGTFRETCSLTSCTPSFTKPMLIRNEATNLVWRMTLIPTCQLRYRVRSSHFLQTKSVKMGKRHGKATHRLPRSGLSVPLIYSVGKTRQTPSSPALTTTLPCEPNAAPRTGARCPLCSFSNVPVRASHVLSVRSADAETSRCDFGAGRFKSVVIASCTRYTSVRARRANPL